jgi:hypothetical protein
VAGDSDKKPCTQIQKLTNMTAACFRFRKDGPQIGVNSILNMKVFLLAAAGSGNLANENSLDLLIS